MKREVRMRREGGEGMGMNIQVFCLQKDHLYSPRRWVHNVLD